LCRSGLYDALTGEPVGITDISVAASCAGGFTYRIGDGQYIDGNRVQMTYAGSDRGTLADHVSVPA
jgi:hypothetical protein